VLQCPTVYSPLSGLVAKEFSFALIIPTVTHYVSASSCAYSAAAQKTGKITCTTGGYILSGSPGQIVTCNGGTRTLVSGGHIVQPNSC
jgi:hypothetical protein